MSLALYDDAAFCPFSPSRGLTSSFLTATCSPLCPSGADEQLEEPLEVLVGVELDQDATAAPTANDLHLRAQRGTQVVRHLREIRVAAKRPGARSAAALRMDHLAHERLRVADRQLLRDDLAERRERIRKR